MGNYLYFKATATQYALLKSTYGTDITSAIEEQFTEEKARAKGCRFSIARQYFLAYLLCLRINKRVVLGETLEEVHTDINMDDLRERFKATWINIDEVYSTLYP